MNQFGILLALSSTLPTLWAFAPHRTIYKYANTNTVQRLEDTKINMGWFDGIASTESKKVPESIKTIHILEPIGSGSYGTVHVSNFVGDDKKLFVAKRAWTLEEIKTRPISTHREKDKPVVDEKEWKGRADRCKYYLEVEQHCLSKISAIEKADEVRAPKFVGKYKDDTDGNNWLLFEMITSKQDDSRVAQSLKAMMELDWIDQHRQDDGGEDQHHHLYLIHKELGMDDSATFDDTLDILLLGLLKAIAGVHKLNIVHRDVKPENLLIDGGKKDLVLIDFGSAQDVDEVRKKIFLMEGEASVALSPIYAAPELFTHWDKAPLNFDTFSAGLVFCQLLFNLLDTRTEAAFRQQLEDVDLDLDQWLERELQASLRPAGLEDGLQYLGYNPGLWNLLKRMLHPNPKRRLSSTQSLAIVTEILSGDKTFTVEDRIELDGKYFNIVIEDLEICTLSDSAEDITEEAPGDMLVVDPRPLHFVATFDRDEPLGLVLAEVDAVEEDEAYTYEQEWKSATIDAKAGDVFVRDIVPGGQADGIGIFEIGDHLAGVGEFPHYGGFGMFVEMLSAVPERSKSVKVHFDRKPSSTTFIDRKDLPESGTITFVSHGAWTSKGRRKTQEDAFIMHQIKDSSSNLLLSGVFDGHGGDAASTFVSETLSSLLSLELTMNKDSTLQFALDTSWDTACDSYRNGCLSDDDLECVAKYDAREGILYAGTSSTDLVAGTTATVAALSLDEDNVISQLVVLNCGDSRTLVVGEPMDGKRHYVRFKTRDHSPSCPKEGKRLRANPNHSDPQCSMNKFWLTVGDYRYAVSRSLEGPLPTSKGITSESDIFLVNLADVASTTTYGMIIQASDGLFEVLDNEEVGREAVDMRKKGLSATDCAHYLCDLAKKKGTSDNVTVTIVYLE